MSIKTSKTEQQKGKHKTEKKKQNIQKVDIYKTCNTHVMETQEEKKGTEEILNP